MTDSAKFKKQLRHLEKQARLQGFVSELEIRELAGASDVEKALTEALKEKGVEINPFVAKSRRMRQSEMPIRPIPDLHDQKKSDPIWNYLNHVGSFPLLNRAQEVEYSRQMVLGKNKLLESAFRSPVIQEYLERLSCELQNGSLSCDDVLDVEQTQDESVDDLYDHFVAGVETILEEQVCIDSLREKVESIAEGKRAEVVESIRDHSDTLVETAFLLSVNERQRKAIVEKYGDWLKENSLDGELENYYSWEKVFSDAKDSVIESNYRLVISIAKKYKATGMELIDVIQEGNRGLMKAVDHFDYRKGYKFSTYATWWIRQAITRAINDKGKAIRIPANTRETMNRVMRYSQRFVLEHGYEPASHEIADALEMPERKVNQVMNYSIDPVSLDRELNDGTDSTMADFVADTTAEDPADTVAIQGLRDSLDE